MRQVVVLCGGAGTRSRQVTSGSQKCMVEVAGAPFLAHVLDVVDQWKPDEVLLLVGHHAEQVVAFATSSERPYRVKYRREASPAGTVGALRAARDLLTSEFLLVLGDVLPPQVDSIWERLAQVAQRTSAAAVMTTAAASQSMDQGNIEVDADLVVSYDKSSPLPLIDRGTRYLQADALDTFSGDDDETFFGSMVPTRALAHVFVEGPVLDVGTPGRRAASSVHAGRVTPCLT
ncbi:NTP transferase domain-containing protein [Brachybacterium sp. GPGPB12]|uniref:NTP transferase domain-containing protein n=1 Tax=Brachybacterium sp. GPGPB12 TaxID=3023517 RepID=UPI0031344639